MQASHDGGTTGKENNSSAWSGPEVYHLSKDPRYERGCLPEVTEGTKAPTSRFSPFSDARNDFATQRRQRKTVAEVCCHQSSFQPNSAEIGVTGHDACIYLSKPRQLLCVQINLKTYDQVQRDTCIFLKTWSHACTLCINVYRRTPVNFEARRIRAHFDPGVQTKGKSLPGWQRWNGIYGWINPQENIPSINNHDWFQGHKLLQVRVWKSGTAYAYWPGIDLQYFKKSTLFEAKEFAEVIVLDCFSESKQRVT